MSKKVFNELSGLHTEKVNPSTINIDIANSNEIVKLINDQDRLVAEAVSKESSHIALAIDQIHTTFNNNGRLIYAGAGTSGRLGVLDASECPPTFGSPHEQVQGLIAGGKEAMFIAQEGAEDHEINGENDLKSISFQKNDIVCGLAASGRTPYVRGCLEYARMIGAKSIIVSTVPKEKLIELNMLADIFICPVVGPEVIMGSTRMKSGTAQKMVLNMLSTGAMIKQGKVYNNVMVDLQLNNLKLVERAKRIIMDLTEVDYETAAIFLEKSNNHVKSAIIMIKKNCSYEEAKNLLKTSNGSVKTALTI